jgi:hypothetical protein
MAKKKKDEEMDLTPAINPLSFYQGLGYDPVYRERVARENINPMSGAGANLLFLDMIRNRRVGGRNVAQAASQLFAPESGSPVASLGGTYYQRHFQFGNNAEKKYQYQNVKQFMNKYGKGIEKQLKAVDKARAREMGLSSRDAGLSSLVKRKKSKLEEEKQEQASLV